MKIKRFVAANMRQAMKKARDEQGPDAVILSTRRLAEGIEIVAATDYDEALVRAAAVHALPAARPALPSAHATAAGADGRPPEPPRPNTGEPPTAIHGMREELGSLREMLETQLASLAWNDLDRRRPAHASALRQLTRMDIDVDIAQTIANELPAGLSADQARYLPLGMLAQRLSGGGRQLSALTGAWVLVGPTGVGKTTTVAKLAAHAVLHHGAAHVALISTDHYRIGAGTQLGQYARLLGVPLYEANDGDELDTLLARLGDRRTILIDSAGMGAQDPQFVAQTAILGGAQPRLRTTLVLAANTQAEAMDDATRAYLPLKPRGCILTKLDESPRLGAALSVLIRHRLPLDFTTDGQRVPEDIAVADVRRLVCRAAAGNRDPDADNDLSMAERFGHLVAATA